MASRVLHFTAEDGEGAEYVVFLEDGDDSEAGDHAIKGFKLYAEGEYELMGRVESAFPFDEVLQKRR